MVQDVRVRTIEQIKKGQQIAFRRYVVGIGSGGTIRNYLYADIKTVREWIAARFTEGMNWNNYGEIWQIDHIVPLRLFDLRDENDLKICWHYKNLMPLMKKDNLHKEGNIFFAYILLNKIKKNDYFFNELFRKINEEVEIMYKYIETHEKVIFTKNVGRPNKAKT